MLKLDPDEVDKAFTTAQRSAAKLVKSFKEVPGCLGIAKQVKDEMADFAQNVPVVQALRNPGMRDRHWDDLTRDLKFELRPDDKFTLRDATEVPPTRTRARAPARARLRARAPTRARARARAPSRGLRLHEEALTLSLTLSRGCGCTRRRRSRRCRR